LELLSLLEFFYKATTVPKANRFFIYKTMFLRNLPVRRIKFDDALDAIRHDRMVDLVEQMLILHNRLAEAKAPHDKSMLQAQVDATDQQIDRLVYELFDMSGEEIRIVEKEMAT
jgi:hypothetical protein